MPTNLLHHGFQNRIQNLVETWRPERDLDCKTWVKQHPKHQKPQRQTKIHLKLFHAQTGSIWFQIGSYRFLWFYSHRSVPTNLNSYLTVHMHMNCSKIGLKMSSGFKVVQYTVHPLTKLSKDPPARFASHHRKDSQRKQRKGQEPQKQPQKICQGHSVSQTQKHAAKRISCHPMK